MRTMWIVPFLLLSAACMHKTADGTYHVNKNNNELKADAKKLGHDLEQKTAEATRKAGAALQHAGDKMKADAQKRH